MSRPPAIDVLRETMRQAVEVSSLRGLARDVGMTAPGLQRFLDGSPPRAATVRKLRDWYIRRSARKGEPDADTAAAALALLLDGVPLGGVRDRGAAQLLDTVAGTFKAAGMRVPEWLAKLRKEGRSG